MPAHWKRFSVAFFVLNLLIPLLVHLLIMLIGLVGPDLRDLWLALVVITGINIGNLYCATLSKGWHRAGYLIITAFNLLSLFAMGALSFFASIFGWLHIVPDLVALFTS